jgi:ATP-dependent Lhr-like helicase
MSAAGPGGSGGGAGPGHARGALGVEAAPGFSPGGTGVEAAPGFSPGGTVEFHPLVDEWFRRRFPEGPTEPQARGWPLVAAGLDTLIAAPTGSGKTLAAFLVAIDALYRAHDEGLDVGSTTRVAYVSPLKSLATDVAVNLEGPLGEIAALARARGVSPPPVRVAVRTGDSSAAERAALVRRPPSLLVTTPESLYLLLTARRGREMLRTVETVIVDEIHALARDKRGAHLALSLERLEAVCGRRVQRVGLSATQRPIEAVARLLVGERPFPAVVDVGHRRELPSSELEAVASAEQVAEVLDRIAELVRQHRTTLVFVNTRRLAERLAHEIAERLGEGAVAAHHGSLSKDRRHKVEARLRAGELRALVATASLELGIDVGPVELVCQVGSPRSIATFLQRVGRSNHSRTGVPKGRLYPLTRDELVEAVALLGAVEEGRLDALEPVERPLDVLAQQVVAEVAAGERGVAELYELCRRAGPYLGLSRAEFDEVVELVSRGVETGRGRRGAHLHHDRVHGRLRPRKGARLAATTSGGAIPETAEYRVVAEPDETFVGTVDEDWALETMGGDVFLLGTHAWRVRRVEHGVVRVQDADGAAPTVPFWLGEAPARTAELSEGVSRLRARVDAHLRAGEPEFAVRELEAVPGVPPHAAAEVVRYLAAARQTLGILPTQTDLVVERFFDETTGMQLVVHAPFGGRVNRAIGLLLRKRFCRTFDFELQAAANDDAVVLSLGPQHSFPLEDLPAFLSRAGVVGALEQAVLDGPMWKARWRWNLNRALVVLRFRGGRRNPPPIQRMEADDALASVFPKAIACQEHRAGPIEIPDHVLVRQTMRDTLSEALDAAGLEALLERIERGQVRVHVRETVEPSLLAHEVLSARPYAFLDGEELQNRRTGAVVLPRGVPTDLRMVAGLDPAAVERVRVEVAPSPASPDELHELLVSAVLVPPRGEWQALFEQLAASRRAEVLVAGGVQRWCATEALPEATAACAGDEAAAAQAVRGHLEVSGVVTAADLARATGLPEGLVERALARLEQEGFALRGRYRPTSAGPQWVARRLLARMHAYSRRARRRAVEPASTADFMRFLLRWQHVAPGTQLSGEHGLVAVLGQLQGFEAPVASFEADLLPSRLERYDPALLDRLCYAGDVAWLRLTPRASGDFPVAATAPSKATPAAVVFRTDLPVLLAAVRGDRACDPGVGATAEVARVLRERGACFAADLVAATRRLPEDVERALWDGAARGLFMCDGFAAVRALVAGRRAAFGCRRWSGAASVRRPGRGQSPTAASAGRWSLVEACRGEPPDPHDLAEAVAAQLLERWGVVFRQLLQREAFRLPWRELQWALRRLEDRGLVRGGRFVAGFGGEQFALPQAAEDLARVLRTPRTGERVVVAGSDPLNLVGVVVPGETVPSLRTRRVVYLDGLPAEVESRPA